MIPHSQEHREKIGRALHGRKKATVVDFKHTEAAGDVTVTPYLIDNKTACLLIYSVSKVFTKKQFLGQLEKKYKSALKLVQWTNSPNYVRRRRILIPHKLRWKIFKRDHYCCGECGSTEDLTVDHIVAVSNGGTNDEANLKTLCRKHNSSKGGRRLCNKKTEGI